MSSLPSSISISSSEVLSKPGSDLPVKTLIIIILLLIFSGIGCFLFWFFKIRKIDCDGRYEDNWSKCDMETGLRTKKFIPLVKPLNGGKVCPPDLKESCNNKITSIINKELGKNVGTYRYKPTDDDNIFEVSYIDPVIGNQIAKVNINEETIDVKNPKPNPLSGKDWWSDKKDNAVNAGCNSGVLSRINIIPKYGTTFSCVDIPYDNSSLKIEYIEPAVSVVDKNNLDEVLLKTPIQCKREGDVIISYASDYDENKKGYRVKLYCATPTTTLKSNVGNTGIQEHGSPDYWDRNNWDCTKTLSALTKIIPETSYDMSNFSSQQKFTCSN